jgi:hypothetical protein
MPAALFLRSLLLCQLAGLLDLGRNMLRYRR